MTYRLFLDDERVPASGPWCLWDQIGDQNPADMAWIVVRTGEEVLPCLERHGTPDHVQFDHDLGTGMNGADVAKLLVERALDGHGFPQTFDVHSQNPIGRKNIEGVMERFQRHLSDS